MSIHNETEADTRAVRTAIKTGREFLGVSAKAGRTPVGRFVLFLGSAYIFLWVPDLDLALISILHHRSIITHSILPALLFLFLGRSLGAAPIAGGLIGISVHLSCDMLSPMVGYAQIWLPAPIKAPLGPLSYLWLGGNAVVGFALASLVASLAFTRKVAYPLVVVVSVVCGATYGFINENSYLSVVTVLCVIAFSLFPEGYIGRRWKAKVGEATEG